MSPVCRQVQIPGARIIQDVNLNDRFSSGTAGFGQIVPHQPRTHTSARLGQLDAGIKPVAARLYVFLHPDTEAQTQYAIHSSHDRHLLHRVRRKILPEHRDRRMLVPQPGETVIRRHKEIVSGYP